MGDDIFQIKKTFYLSTSVPDRCAFLIRFATAVLYAKIAFTVIYETIGPDWIVLQSIIKSTQKKKKKIPKFIADSRFLAQCQLVRVISMLSLGWKSGYDFRKGMGLI